MPKPVAGAVAPNGFAKNAAFGASFISCGVAHRSGRIYAPEKPGECVLGCRQKPLMPLIGHEDSAGDAAIRFAPRLPAVPVVRACVGRLRTNRASVSQSSRSRAHRR